MPSDPQAQRDAYITSESKSLTPELRDALKSVESSVEQMNRTVKWAMEAGLVIELRRRHRVHSGDGCWADQLAPLMHAKQR